MKVTAVGARFIRQARQWAQRWALEKAQEDFRRGYRGFAETAELYAFLDAPSELVLRFPQKQC